MPEAIGRIVYDASWRIVEANDSAHRLLKTAQLVGLDWRSVGRMTVGGPWPRPPSLPCSVHRLFRLADGTQRGFLAYMRRIGDDVCVSFEPADWSLSFADQLHTTIVVTNERGIVVYANQAAADLYGCTREQLLGRGAYEMAERVALDPADLTTVLSGMAQGRPLTDAFSIAALDGTNRRLLFHTSEWRYRGLPCGAIWCLTDVTDHVEPRLQQAAAVWYKVAATFQHELRNPLQTMQAALELLRPGLAPDELKLVTVLEQQVQLMSDYLLDQLRPPAPTALVPGLLSDVVEGEVERSAIRITTRQLSFAHHRPAKEPLVRLHRGSMSRVFANLFRNSAQARMDATVQIDYEVTGDSITCVVSDNGPGFDHEAVHGRLLGLRQAALEHLGLAIVTSTVEAHGGAVTAGNEPQGGAYIKIRLPVVQRRAIDGRSITSRSMAVGMPDA